MTFGAVAVGQNVSDATLELAGEPVRYLLPAGTQIELKFLSEVGSKTHERGNRFPMEVTAPVLIDDQTLVPAGAYAEGEVVHAQKAGVGGKAGELILAARFLRVAGVQVPLRSFTAGTGENQSSLSAGVSVAVGLPGFFITGKNIVVASGTAVSARVAQDAHIITTDNQKREATNGSE